MVALVGRLDRKRAVVDFTGPAVDRDCRPARPSSAPSAADNAGQAKRPADYGGMRGAAAKLGDDGARCDHAVQVVRARGWAGENDGLSRLRTPLGLVGMRPGADADARRSALAGGQGVGAVKRRSD